MAFIKEAVMTIETKKCSGCGEDKPLTEYHKKGNRLRSDCKTCRNLEKAAYREKNAEKIKAKDAEYREKNKEVLAERQRQWREEHPERYGEIHRKWKQANKDKVNESTKRRRRLLAEAKGEMTRAQWKELKARYGNRCLCCGRQEPEVKLTPDHVIPVAQGGSNGVENRQPLCVSCNSKKYTGRLDFRPKE
jgi:hypothetical protein